MKKKVALIIKVVVTLVLCTVILANANWKQILSAVKNADLRLILIIFICMLFNIVVSAKKWQILLTVHNMQIRLRSLTRYYLVGLFFSNFLPSTIGGDGYRMFRIYQLHNSKSGAVIPVVFERLIGFFVLLLLGGIAGIFSFIEYGDDISKTGLVLGLGSSALAVLFFLLGYNLKVKKWIETVKWFPEKLKNAVGQMALYKMEWKKVLKCHLITLLFYMLLFFYRYLMIRAVGQSCPFFSLVVVTMLSTVIANLPISINGIGLLDGSFIYLISNFGVEYDTALIVMLLQRSLTALASLFGGYFYLKDKEPGLVAENGKTLKGIV